MQLRTIIIGANPQHSCSFMTLASSNPPQELLSPGEYDQISSELRASGVPSSDEVS